MADPKRFYQTTAIDYPNSRPHIGTAFEKLGADVQARYRRMEGDAVHFLMGNDENTVKVAKRAAELGLDPKTYCDDMARQFKEVWRALEISFDDFIQTSEERHHVACQKFIQKVYEAGYIYKGAYEGWYCDGCESFKTETEVKEAGGLCPVHRAPVVRRSEPCHYFALSRFQDQLLRYYEEHPEFIQPEARRNEVIAFVKSGLQDVNITRHGQTWGIRVPFDPEFTIWVWFDALINYISAIGYGTDEERFKKWWPADIHFIGKDITRFHCALWPAMLWAAGLEAPRHVFGHGFVYIKNEDTGEVEKISKSLGNVVEPMDIVTQFSAEAFRFYFMRECPFPGDGEFSWHRFAEVYNAELANNLGNLYSRVITLLVRNFEGILTGTAGKQPQEIMPAVAPSTREQHAVVPGEELIRQIKNNIENCQYSHALQRIWQHVLVPANQYIENTKPWSLVKTQPSGAKQVLFDLVEPLRSASILLKPFLPKTAETIYRSFNFAQPWEAVRYADAAKPVPQAEDLRVLAELEGGKVKPLFPRIG